MSLAIRETVLPFGETSAAEGKRLFGILTRPATIATEKPVIVIPNTGFEHRVGPNRLHVQVARALAAAGYCVLRFDVSGLGDSDPPRGAAASALDDARLALDALDHLRLGSRYVLIGLCSGAHDAHQLARVDSRVVGLFCIDGYAFATPKFRRLQWWARLTHPTRTLRNMMGRIDPAYRIAEPQGMEAELIAWPGFDEVAADYQAFLDRQLHMAFVFTGDIQMIYLYADQHYELFPALRGWAPVWFLPHIDHTLTRRAAREEMIAHIRKWLLSLSD